MSTTQITLPETTFARVKEILNINFKPHPYTVGTKHIIEAQKYGGMLGEEVIRTVPCAFNEGTYKPRCTLPYEQHTSDKVAVVQLKTDTDNKAMGLWLYSIKPWLLEQAVDGVVFLESTEGYKIAEYKETTTDE